MTSNNFVAWLHIGDLHASDEDDWESVATLARIVDEVRRNLPQGALDFAYLPGDNANHGEREQYRRVADVLAELPLPCHAIPGDHDFEPGSLETFRQTLAPLPLPRAVRMNGRRALFLDLVSAGSGGPDFRLGPAQTAWLQRELAESHDASEPRPLVFMHAFPGDLHEGAQALGRLFAEAKVALVDTGHTHYNELLNDGAVVYSATRSTGQIEEGHAGFSIAAVDGNAASWRFKEIDSGWPFVMITSPADERMTVAGTELAPTASLEVHAMVLGKDIAMVEVALDDDAPLPMQPAAERPGLWTAVVERPVTGAHRIVVRATTASHEIGQDEIRIQAAPEIRRIDAFGEHRHTVGAWPEHGLLGTRLGPNANGKHW